ncbi:hypothetical protein F5Y09DRAFT_314759 [Xylaria sp. FL1042]|nr:hypothetical protein F5Y09DRAFT_314759 [Xylaria sp. FL1042]
MDGPDRSQFLISRSRVPTDEAARFVEARVVLSGQSDAVYSERGGNFVTVQEGEKQEKISIEMWKQVDTEKERLFDLIEQVQKKIKDQGNSRLSSMELRHCTWDQVMVQVKETSLLWKSSSRRSSRAMRCIDKLGQNSEAFKSWLDLLPDGDYGASISGVFAIIIGAAGRYTKVEDDIFQTLVEIPEVLERSRRYIKIYADLRDNSLERRTFDLFRSIIRTLCHVMQFFKDSTARKFSESILKQGSYKKELIESLAEVTKNSEKVLEEANECLAWRLLKQENMLRQTDEKTDQGLHILQSIHQLLLASQILGAQTRGHNGENGTTSTAAYHTMAAIESLTSDQKDESNGDSYYSAGRQNRGSKRAFARDSVRRAEKLLQLLRYDPGAISADVNTCLELGEALNEDKKAHAATTIQNTRFREFMTGNLESSSLLINGRVDLSSTEGLSSLSFVAAKLVRISETIDSPSTSPYVVKYFCKQHPPFLSESAVSPPIAMMASLVGQLLAQMIRKTLDVDLSILTRDKWKKTENFKLKTLWDIFQELTYQLPSQSVLLCIIDDIGMYEIAPLSKETEAIIRGLARLVPKHDRIVFKLLVTCEGRALDISKYFMNQTVDLVTEVEPDEAASWRISRLGQCGTVKDRFHYSGELMDE